MSVMSEKEKEMKNINLKLSGKDNKIIFEINALMDKINKLFRIIS